MGKRDFCLQVRMNISTDVDLPHWRCPTHYRLRRVEMGDKMRLSELLVSIGVGWTKFDVPRMSQYMKEPDRWDGSHVVEYQGRLVALCIVTRRGEFDPVWGQLDYVCVHPRHRGRGLGLGVCTAGIQYQRSRGYLAATLTTLEITPGSLQLVAMKMCLGMQFYPIITHYNQTACKMVYQALGWRLPVQWWRGTSPFDPIDDPQA